MCDCMLKDFEFEMKCPQGKTLVHLEDHEFQMNQLQQKLDNALGEIEAFKEAQRKRNNEENETLNHLRVEQSQHQVKLTLRGKCKMFTPKAIKDLISKLQVMAENAESYEPSAMIHCRHGEKAPVINFGSNPLLREF